MTRTDSMLRVALVGFGHAGAVFHAPLIESTPGMRVAAIVTAAPERVERASREYPRACILPTVEALWDAADQYDLAVIAAPNRVHVPLGIAALESGLPVIIDKPLAPTVTEACALIDTARSVHRLLTVFHNARWSIPFLTVQHVIRCGLLGPIVSYEARMERYRPAPRVGAWRERGAPEEAGGLLYDLGSHLIDQALQLFGPVTHVYAELDHRRPGTEVDDDSFVCLRFASGVRARLWMSYLAQLPGPVARVTGLHGTFIKMDADPQEAALQSGMQPCDSNWGIETREHWGYLSAEIAGVQIKQLVESQRGAYQEFYAQLRDALLSGAPPPVDPEDAVKGLKVIEAAQASARGNCVVAMAASQAEGSR
jgi:predicted dehydrogenase